MCEIPQLTQQQRLGLYTFIYDAAVRQYYVRRGSTCLGAIYEFESQLFCVSPFYAVQRRRVGTCVSGVGRTVNFDDRRYVNRSRYDRHVADNNSLVGWSIVRDIATNPALSRQFSERLS